MATSLTALAARERIANLRRAATGRGARVSEPAAPAHHGAVTSARSAAAVRFAHRDEAGTLQRLAELDDAPELAGEILVATIDAEVVAALSLQDGRVVANPFVLTCDAVQLLRCCATGLTGRPRRRWRSALRPRLA